MKKLRSIAKPLQSGGCKEEGRGTPWWNARPDNAADAALQAEFCGFVFLWNRAFHTAGDGLVLQELGVLGRVFAAFCIRRGIRSRVRFRIRHDLGFVLDGLSCLKFLILFCERLLD